MVGFDAGLPIGSGYEERRFAGPGRAKPMLMGYLSVMTAVKHVQGQKVESGSIQAWRS